MYHNRRNRANRYDHREPGPSRASRSVEPHNRYDDYEVIDRRLRDGAPERPYGEPDARWAETWQDNRDTRWIDRIPREFSPRRDTWRDSR
jgi:hypothetical protein